MFDALYRKLPGGRFLKWLQIFALATVSVFILFTLVFPLVETLIAENPALNEN